MRKKISIISPCFNEEQAVDKFFYEIFLAISKITEYEFELLIINDGSNDQTLEKLKKYAENNSQITIIDLNRNFGKEAALSAGIDNCIGDAAIILDFDLQHPIELIPDFINKWQEGFEAVIGIRKDREDEKFFKKKSAEIFYSIYNSFSQIKIPKNSGDFRLLDRKIIDQLKTLPERERFMKGLFSWIGAKSSYINYQTKKRNCGKTKFSIWKLWNFAIDGITSFSTIPLKIWTYLGAFIATLSFFYGFYIFAQTLIYGVKVPGYSSLIVTILFSSGIQIMGIGILGEYLGRTYIESKQRPRYLIREIVKQK